MDPFRGRRSAVSPRRLQLPDLLLLMPPVIRPTWTKLDDDCKSREMPWSRGRARGAELLEGAWSRCPGDWCLGKADSKCMAFWELPLVLGNWPDGE